MSSPTEESVLTSSRQESAKDLPRPSLEPWRGRQNVWPGARDSALNSRSVNLLERDRNHGHDAPCWSLYDVSSRPICWFDTIVSTCPG